MKKVLMVIGFLITSHATLGAQNPLPPVRTVEAVDLQKYLGKWYEIAAIPQSFEKQCVANTTAEYSIADGGLISVVNVCDTFKGQKSLANGRAKVVDTASNSKLKVSFVNFLGWQFLFGGDYWILGIGENYSYAVVGTPDRNYAWVLSRTSKMTDEELKEANHVLVSQGFDTCKLISTTQDFGLQVRTPLCQIVSGK